MKTLLNYFLLLLFLGVASCQNASKNATSDITNEIDIEKEKAAIIAILEGESTAFWEKDYDKWATYWAQEPYIRTMGWWKDGGVTVVEGWDARAKRSRNNFEISPDPNATATTVRRENINIRVFEEVAWLTFDQYGEDTGDTLLDMPGLSRETRIMEKHDGVWKIVYVGWLLEGE